MEVLNPKPYTLNPKPLNPNKLHNQLLVNVSLLNLQEGSDNLQVCPLLQRKPAQQKRKPGRASLWTFKGLRLTLFKSSGSEKLQEYACPGSSKWGYLPQKCISSRWGWVFVEESWRRNIHMKFNHAHGHVMQITNDRLGRAISM